MGPGYDPDIAITTVALVPEKSDGRSNEPNRTTEGTEPGV